MFDRPALFRRFLEAYGVARSVDLIHILGVKSSTVSQWKTGLHQVPWNRLLAAAGEKGVRWEWLLEGTPPKFREGAAGRSAAGFDTAGINRRFLSLYPHGTQNELARRFGVSQITVHKWKAGKMQIPWEKLKQAADENGVSWDWLIDGYGG